MKLLIKDAIIHGVSSTRAEKGDIEITNDVISAMGSIPASPEHEVIAIDDVHCSSGWFDPFVNFGVPGNEHKEDFATGCAAAARGGFVEVGLLPDTDPLIENRPQLDFIAKSSSQFPVEITAHPSFVKGASGNELSEIAEMAASGVLSFIYPGRQRVKSALLLKALEYAKVTGKKITVSATDFSMIPDAFMHEGLVNVALGLRGIPVFTEELMISRYVELLRYTGSAMHISGVSSAKGAALIGKAKQDGLHLSADTSVYNLLFTDDVLKTFDTNYKLNPPIREEQDRQALIAAVKSGVIDMVTSQHQPHEEDAKKCEIKTAEFGVIGLQTLFPLLLQEFTLDEVLQILINRNRAGFGKDIPLMEQGSKASLTLFDPEKEWKFDADSNLSKSRNSMFFGGTLKGTGLGVVVGKQRTL